MANVVQYILDIKTGKASKGLKKMGDSADRAEKKLGRVKKSGLKMASQLGNAVTGMAAGIGMATAAFGTMFRAVQDLAVGARDLTKEVVDSVNNLNDLSAVSGLTAQTIQALTASFQASGQEAGKAQAFVGRWPKIYSDLAAEGTKASVAARQLGIEVKNSDGSMKSSDELLRNITKSLQAVKNDTERATAGFAILGRAGADFLQALGKTSEFEAFHKLTEQFGVKTSPRASAEAAEFQATMAAVQVVVAGLKQDFINATNGVGIFIGFMRKTIVVAVALQEMISNNQEAFELLGQSMATMSAGLFEMFQGLSGAFANYLADMIRNTLIQWTAVLLLLKQIGAISEEQFQTAGKVIGGAGGSSEALRTITQEFSEMEFGESKGAEEALASLDAILAGLDDQTVMTKFSLGELDDALKDTGDQAEKTAKVVRSAEEKKFDAQWEAFDRFVANTAAAFETLNMTPLQKELFAIEQTITGLEDALEFYDAWTENIENITEVEQLLSKARAEQTRIMESGIVAMEQTSMAFSQMIESFAISAEAIQSPEQFLRALPGMLEQSPELAGSASELLAGGAQSIAGRIGVEGGTKVVAAAGKAGAGLVSAAGAAATAAPIVGALGLIAVSLAKLGESTQAEINEKFDSFIVNFEKGIDLLPKLLINVLPEFIAQISKLLFVDLFKLIALDLPIALIAAIPILVVEVVKEVILLIADIYKGIVRGMEGIRDFIDLLKTEGIKGIIESFKVAFRELMGDMKDWFVEAFSMRSGGRFIPSAAGGIRFTGTESGLALLHRGETVVPESNVTSQAVNRRMNRSMNGMNIIINADIIEGNAVDALVRKIEERFYDFGASTSPLFGGT